MSSVGRCAAAAGSYECKNSRVIKKKSNAHTHRKTKRERLGGFLVELFFLFFCSKLRTRGNFAGLANGRFLHFNEFTMRQIMKWDDKTIPRVYFTGARKEIFFYRSSSSFFFLRTLLRRVRKMNPLYLFIIFIFLQY